MSKKIPNLRGTLARPTKTKAQIDERISRQEKRREFREKVGHCQHCGTKGISSLTVHHIEPLGCGGPDAPVNWCVLCADCHEKWHKYEQECMLAIARQRFPKWLEKGRKNRNVSGFPEI